MQQALIAAPAGAWPGAGDVGRAIEKGRAFLLSSIDDDGAVRDEPAVDDLRYGERTAAAVYALISAGVDPSEKTLARAIAFLNKANLKTTIGVSFRACAMAQIADETVAIPLLRKDVDWLRGACDEQGGYGMLSGADGEQVSDNLNTQMAMMALAAAAGRGIQLPQDFWRKVERYWVSQQQGDGGWAYRMREARGARSYGSMTAGALASLLICRDYVQREEILAGRPTGQDKHISAGTKWLVDNFSVTENPGIGHNRLYQYLLSIKRFALAGGRKYIGGRNWYDEGARELLIRQNDDGSWGYYPQVIMESSLALMFLGQGGQPILMNKLQYAGRWNARPRDAANLVHWMSLNFESKGSWQVVDPQSDLADLHDAPLLYISGAGPFEMSDEQVEKLRTYVLQGGTILSESAANNGDFTLDMQKLSRRLFPDFPLKRLDDNHQLYTAYFRPEVRPGLLAVDNGVRLLLVHSPRELSLALQLAEDGSRPWFELVTNIHFFSTDKAGMRDRTSRDSWGQVGDFEPTVTIRAARIRFDGNWNPEPLAMRRLELHLARLHQAKLVVQEVEIAALHAPSHHVAVMTGTGPFELDDVQREALAEYLRLGGRLVVDSAGGGNEFSECVRKYILPLCDRTGPVSPDHSVYSLPVKIESVAFRRAYAQALGDKSREPRLIGGQLNGRLAVVFSPEDITGALVGEGGFNIRGYNHDSAVRLMTNLLWPWRDQPVVQVDVIKPLMGR